MNFTAARAKRPLPPPPEHRQDDRPKPHHDSPPRRNEPTANNPGKQPRQTRYTAHLSVPFRSLRAAVNRAMSRLFLRFLDRRDTRSHRIRSRAPACGGRARPLSVSRMGGEPVTVSSMLDSAGRRRSPATLPGFHAGRAPRNKGMRYPACASSTVPPAGERGQLQRSAASFAGTPPRRASADVSRRTSCATHTPSSSPARASR
jgi:hypothetical protein